MNEFLANLQLQARAHPWATAAVAFIAGAIIF